MCWWRRSHCTKMNHGAKCRSVDCIQSRFSIIIDWYQPQLRVYEVGKTNLSSTEAKNTENSLFFFLFSSLNDKWMDWQGDKGWPVHILVLFKAPVGQKQKPRKYLFKSAEMTDSIIQRRFSGTDMNRIADFALSCERFNRWVTGKKSVNRPSHYAFPKHTFSFDFRSNINNVSNFPLTHMDHVHPNTVNIV